MAVFIFPKKQNIQFICQEDSRGLQDSWTVLRISTESPASVTFAESPRQAKAIYSTFLKPQGFTEWGPPSLKETESLSRCVRWHWSGTKKGASKQPSCSDVKLPFRSRGQHAFVNWAFPCQAHLGQEPFTPYRNAKPRLPGLLSTTAETQKDPMHEAVFFSRKTFGEMLGRRLFPVQTAFQGLWLSTDSASIASKCTGLAKIIWT